MPRKDDDEAPISAEDLLREDDVLEEIAEGVLEDDGELADALDAAIEDAAKAAVDDIESRIDPNHPVLTVAEQREALQKAHDKIQASRRKKAMDALVATEMQRLQGATGLVTGDAVRDEMVTVSLDLAEHSDGITINGAKFWHGHTYTLPRHVADGLREIQARGHNHQNELDGKGISDRYRLPRMDVINGATGAVSTPQRVS